MWGKGIYFATQASYSHGYAHRPEGITTNRYQMFLAKVICGDSYDCLPDSKLVMPPEKPAQYLSGVQLERQRFDSVTGVTGNVQVYIVYSNSRAYPLYLITYETLTV